MLLCVSFSSLSVLSVCSSHHYLIMNRVVWVIWFNLISRLAASRMLCCCLCWWWWWCYVLSYNLSQERWKDYYPSHWQRVRSFLVCNFANWPSREMCDRHRLNVVDEQTHSRCHAQSELLSKHSSHLWPGDRSTSCPVMSNSQYQLFYRSTLDRQHQWCFTNSVLIVCCASVP